MHPPSPGSKEPVLKCAGGGLCRFRISVEREKSFFNKAALSTYMCQKCAAKLGKTELHYKPPIEINEEESD
eukprot:3052384-Ditylum_brightwellii.AAC.1